MKQAHPPRGGSVTALHWQTWKPVEVIWRDGVIASVAPAPTGAGAGRWIAPSLFDIQVNGYGGVDFLQAVLTADDLRRAARALRRDGCTRFFFTLITSEWKGLLARLRHAKALRDADPELRNAIAGWHIEGPFISGEPGFVGAHPPEHVRDPEPVAIRALREVTGSDPALLTIAPERNGAAEAAALASSLGMTVFGGHSNAAGTQLDAAAASGLTGYTHRAKHLYHFSLNRCIVMAHSIFLSHLTSSLQRFGAGNNFSQFRRNRSLPRTVALKGNLADQVIGVRTRLLHGLHTGTVLADRTAQQRRIDFQAHNPRQQGIQQFPWIGFQNPACNRLLSKTRVQGRQIHRNNSLNQRLLGHRPLQRIISQIDFIDTAADKRRL